MGLFADYDRVYPQVTGHFVDRSGFWWSPAEGHDRVPIAYGFGARGWVDGGDFQDG